MPLVLQVRNFYPRPPRGGRQAKPVGKWHCENFYPRPPRGGRHASELLPGVWLVISIHALREEGDRPCAPHRMSILSFLSTPSARRATVQCMIDFVKLFEFLSTPSARRATRGICACLPFVHYFYPRPPRGGRLIDFYYFYVPNHFYPRPPRGGRLFLPVLLLIDFSDFYPRPPRGGRQIDCFSFSCGYVISIHALREEGDDVLFS